MRVHALPRIVMAGIVGWVGFMLFSPPMVEAQVHRQSCASENNRGCKVEVLPGRGEIPVRADPRLDGMTIGDAKGKEIFDAECFVAYNYLRIPNWVRINFYGRRGYIAAEYLIEVDKEIPACRGY